MTGKTARATAEHRPGAGHWKAFNFSLSLDSPFFPSFMEQGACWDSPTRRVVCSSCAAAVEPRLILKSSRFFCARAQAAHLLAPATKENKARGSQAQPGGAHLPAFFHIHCTARPNTVHWEAASASKGIFWRRGERAVCFGQSEGGEIDEKVRSTCCQRSSKRCPLPQHGLGVRS
ncbi:hypothetical protein AOLI_G00068360 [Acnodon oligacanthus]